MMKFLLSLTLTLTIPTSFYALKLTHNIDKISDLYPAQEKCHFSFNKNFFVGASLCAHLNDRGMDRTKWLGNSL